MNQIQRLNAENLQLKAAVAELAQDLDRANFARDHLRQQANELKGLAIALVRKLKSLAEDYNASAKDPIYLSKEDWTHATSPDDPDLKAGRGVVLLVNETEQGGKLVDLGDVEQPEEPAAEAKA